MIVAYILMLVSIGMGAAIRDASLPSLTGAQLVLDRQMMLLSYGLSIALLLGAFVTLSGSLRSFLRPYALCGPFGRLLRGLSLIVLAVAGAVAIALWTGPAFASPSLASRLLVALAWGAYAFNLVLLMTGIALLGRRFYFVTTTRVPWV